jgi:hypothetical protein
LGEGFVPHAPHHQSVRSQQRKNARAMRRIARYWNTDVLNNPEGVLTDLLLQLAAPLTPSSSLNL